MTSSDGTRLRSAAWLDGDDIPAFIHRASLRAEGLSDDAVRGRPVIGICNSWSELVNCNVHFRALAAAVKRGVLLAGGLPLEFPTISLGESLMKPTAMLFRNLMAMDVEECLRAYPLDGVVLLGGCDKTIPAQLMGAISVDLPTIMISGGPSQPAMFRGRALGVGTDLWHYADDVRAGRMTAEEFAELEAAATPSVGHCPEMGTASTMSSAAEALGMMLAGAASIPAVDSRRAAMAEMTGRRAVELVREDLRPSWILSPRAFDNAVKVLAAIGGSTNAVIHLLAIAGRAGVSLDLGRIDALVREVPVLANVRPSGDHLVEQLFHAGGIPALMREMLPLLEADAETVAGTVADRARVAASPDRAVIATLQQPFKAAGGLAVLFGSLAPRGAIVKRSAASGTLDRHHGPALVFNSVQELAARIDDPDLDVTPATVLVLRNAGPKGGPGMPEWGQLPIPQKLLRQGVTDMVRVSDARMSGSAFGTVVLHVCPESYERGPLAAVQDGDMINLNLDARKLDLQVEPATIERRLHELPPSPAAYARGYGKLFLDHVLQADEGCDFDFLRRNEPPSREPLGILSGWIGGW